MLELIEVIAHLSARVKLEITAFRIAPRLWYIRCGIDEFRGV